MNLNNSSEEFLALESHLEALFRVRQQLLKDGALSTTVALEADAASGGSQYALLQFSAATKSEKTRIALEGIVSTVWETIKKLLKKALDLIKRFLAWLRGDGKKFDEAHLRQVDELGKKLGDAVEGLTKILQSAHLRERYEEALYSALMGDLPAHARAILDANSEYSKAVMSLSQAFDKGDYTDIIEKGVASLVAWYEKETKRAEEMDASGETTHQDLEAFAKELDTDYGSQHEGGGTISSLAARNSLELTKGRYEAIKQAKSVISSHQYAAVPKQVSALKSVVLAAQTKINIAGASKSMGYAQTALESMAKHLDTVSMKIDRMTAEAGTGKVLVAQQAVARAFTKHLRELMESFQTVIAAHEFLYQVWRETQATTLKIWQQMIKTYDQVVIDESMSDAQRQQRAELEKKANQYLKEYAGAF
jgi:hypothetical protein